jgi:mycoredoxin-dependent peroxiredoxin
MIPVGDLAPDLACPDQNNQPVTLSAFRGTADVLVVFFPLAFTGICEQELDQIQALTSGFDDGVIALAVSVSPPPIHKVWARRRGYTFPILSDFWPHGAAASAFGVFNERSGMADRGTFVVDRSGRVRFADCRQPGEMREAALWSAAIGALQAG